MAEPGRNTGGDFVEESGQAQLGRQDKKAEQEEDSWPVDETHGAPRRQLGENDDRDRTQQRDAGAIQFQARNATRRDAEIGKREYCQHRRDCGRWVTGGGAHAGPRASVNDFTPGAAPLSLNPVLAWSYSVLSEPVVARPIAERRREHASEHLQSLFSTARPRLRVAEWMSG